MSNIYRSKRGRKPTTLWRVLRALRHLNSIHVPATAGAIHKELPVVGYSTIMAALVTLVNDFGAIRRPLPGCEHIGVYTLASHAEQVGITYSNEQARLFRYMENASLIQLGDWEKRNNG